MLRLLRRAFGCLLLLALTASSGGCRGLAGYASSPDRSARDASTDTTSTDSSLDSHRDLDGSDGGSSRTDVVAHDLLVADTTPADQGGPRWLEVANIKAAPAACASWAYDATAGGCVLSSYDCSGGGVGSRLFAVPQGLTYDRVRIYIVGRHYFSTDGFDVDTSGGFNINSSYVEGVSITTTSRQHIYTFAAGLLRNKLQAGNCPAHGGLGPPSFIGNQWTCDSANTTQNWGAKWYPGTLWGSTSTDSQGQPPAKPHFYEATLALPSSDPIEVRLMQDGCDELVAITELEIYVHEVGAP